MKEVWKDLIYQGQNYGAYYEVSSLGQIRNTKTKKIRKQNISQTGYYCVNGSLGSRKNKITFKVHKAVAETFIANPNNLPVPNHKDGNKLNNHIDNLEWCTYSENMQHAYANDLINLPCGEEAFTSKLDNEAVKYIRENYIPRHREYGTRALGRKFGVDHETIRSVLKNETWTHVK